MIYKNFSLDTVLNNLRIEQLNAMQAESLQTLPEKDQVLIFAPTGSGKTLAYLLPAIEHIDTSRKQTQVMVVAPSRELALQIEQVFRSLGTGIKITCCYGGHKREIEENNLLEAPAIIVGTPGRLGDHIRRGNINTAEISLLILDEFDKTLEFGFTDEVAFLAEELKGLRKKMLISATEAIDIPDYMGIERPAVLYYANEAERQNALSLQVLHSPEADKIDTLFALLCLAGSRSSIVFCNHRESVERCSELLKEKGIHNEYYHGAMEQRDRESALSKFRNGSSYVLVTTDIAARGLDIPNIRYIIHYHLPHTEDIFTHRNGRTARMDASGTAVLLLGPNESVPDYITEDLPEVAFPEKLTPPERPKWSTLCFSLGKKDKVNKIDFVGFLSQQGQLKKEDIGLIEVKDFNAFVAVRKNKLGEALRRIQDQKIKNKKVKVTIAK